MFGAEGVPGSQKNHPNILYNIEEEKLKKKICPTFPYKKLFREECEGLRVCQAVKRITHLFLRSLLSRFLSICSAIIKSDSTPSLPTKTT